MLLLDNSFLADLCSGEQSRCNLSNKIHNNFQMSNLLQICSTFFDSSGKKIQDFILPTTLQCHISYITLIIHTRLKYCRYGVKHSITNLTQSESHSSYLTHLLLSKITTFGLQKQMIQRSFNHFLMLYSETCLLRQALGEKCCTQCRKYRLMVKRE